LREACLRLGCPLNQSNKRWLLPAFLDMPQPRVEHFFHTAEVGTPQIARVVKAPVDGVEPGVHMRGEKADTIPINVALKSIGTPMARVSC
jgi:hypothetical protein